MHDAYGGHPMHDLEEFHHDLLQEIYAEADAEGAFLENSFVELFSRYIEEAGELEGLDYSQYKSRGLRVDGYNYVPEEGLLNLVISDFQGGSEVGSLTKTEVASIFKRLENFFSKSLNALHRQKKEHLMRFFLF